MTESPTLSPDFMRQFHEAPAPIAPSSPLTIDETVEAIMDLDPSEWADFGLHHATDYAAGTDQETLGLFDLAVTAWETTARTVATMDWGNWSDDPE